MIAAIAILGLLLIFLPAAALFVLGAHVVKRHPGEYDPARNAPRYVRPALFLICAIIIGGGLLLTAGIAALANL